MITFIKDFTRTIVEFTVTGLLIILHLVYHILHKLKKVLKLMYKEVIIPITHQTIEILESLVMNLYQEMLFFLSVVFMGIADFSIWVSHVCQNKAKEFQKKRRWL